MHISVSSTSDNPEILIELGLMNSDGSFVEFRSSSFDPDNNNGSVESMYSDRMLSWDYVLFNKCLKEVFGNQGQDFSNRKPEDIQSFLTMYVGSPVTLMEVRRYVNVSTGFPCWLFIFQK